MYEEVVEKREVDMITYSFLFYLYDREYHIQTFMHLKLNNVNLYLGFCSVLVNESNIN